MNAQPFSGSTTAEKRRTVEDERRARLLDEKTRLMGIDVDALAQQAAEKRRIQEYEKERDNAYAYQMVELDKQCCRIDEELQTMRTQKAKDVNEFRKGYQRRDQTREWDLNDKRAERRPDALPIRLGDNDSRLGPSSAQVFVGEEPHAKERKKAMQDQLRRWAGQIVDERDMRKWAATEEQRMFEERDEEMTRKAYEIQKSIDSERKRVGRETAVFNKTLSEIQKAEGHLKKYREQQVNMAEIQQALDSDLLTESPAATINVNDASRFRSDNMKGFLPHQSQAILEEQQQQRDELAARREQEKLQDRAWDTMQARQTRAAMLLDRQKERDRRQQMTVLAEERRRQAEEAAERRRMLQDLHVSSVGDEFQSRFGSSAR